MRAIPHTLLWFALCLLVGCAGHAPAGTTTPSTSSASKAGVSWQPWERATFERAAREHKYLLVSVQTQWCHWCHVMNDVTYRDPRVLQTLAERFVVVRVDADARPDVAERYARWGWPATALLTPDAQGILNLRGYQEPDAFAKLLDEVARTGKASAQPQLGAPANTASTRAFGAIRDAARAQLDAQWDRAQGGWGTPQKYPRSAPIEHELFLAATANDAQRKANALRALAGYARLIDPVAGGMFQYSVNADWEHPHFEKIHAVQAGAIESFVQAFHATGDRQWLSRAREISSYLLQTLRRADGGFYANQDADVGHPGDVDHETGAAFYARSAAERVKTRAPSIDMHVYTNLNGMSIAALCELYEATGDELTLAAAVRAYEVIEHEHRRGQGYSHDAAKAEAEGTLAYFTDNLELARALFALQETTGDAKYGRRLTELLAYIVETFEDREHGGFFAHTKDPHALGVFAEPPKSSSDNARFARLLLWVARREGEHADPAMQQRVERTLRVFGEPSALEDQGRDIGDYLLALQELLSSFVNVTIVGDNADPRTVALRRAALASYAPNRHVLVVGAEESHYPYPDEPAAYLCSNASCSLPITRPAALGPALQRALSAD